MILVTQNNDEYEIRFGYDAKIVELVKNVPGRMWHPEDKFWSIPKARLGFLIAQFRGTPYESQMFIKSDEDLNVNASIDEPNMIPDIDVSDVTWYVAEGCKVFKHQIDTVKFAKWRYLNGLKSGFILADQPGCISGDVEIQIKEPNKPATRSVTLRNAFNLFKKGKYFQIKCLCNNKFVYMPVKNVIDSGEKKCIRITLSDGKSIVCTPDHEIYAESGWINATDLKVGDKVNCNGQLVCPLCGSTEDVISNKYSKFSGYCRKCIYTKLRNRDKSLNYWGAEIVKRIDEWGYVRLFGPGTWSMPSFSTVNGMGVYEHHQVWYEHTGHVVDTHLEAVHHIDGDKTNNSFENLELLSISEHGKLHSSVGKYHLPNMNTNNDYYYHKGVKIWLVPHLVDIVNIEDAGVQHVYDVSIDDDEIHNFVANNIVVHNCGKSLSVTEWAMYMKEHYQARHCLIIACVNSAKYNWREDIIKHTQGKEIPYLLGTRKKRDGSFRLDTGSKEKLEDLINLKMYGKDEEDLPYFIIMNIEAVRMKVGKNFAIADRLIELINAGEINIIALDEVHLNTSAHSVQGKQLLRIKRSVKTQIQWIPLTGTPITSRPTDVFLPLRLVDGHQSNSYYNWCQEYCVYGGFGDHEVVGYKNIPKLKNMLQPNMLRRLKKDILDLPPKVYKTEYIDNSPYQDRLYKKVLAELKANKPAILKSMRPVTSLLRLRQINGSPELVDPSNCSSNEPGYLTKNAKLTRLLELIDDILSEPSEKVVIFSNWVEPLRTLYRYITQRYKVCCYTGTMSAEDREKHKSAFINDPERRIMLGTVGALGTSHTLTVARNVIFYDSPWNPAGKEQAEDRCHRPGTTDTVFVYNLVTRDTVDEKVNQILSRKEGTAQYIVDDELDLRSHPELLDFLLD